MTAGRRYAYTVMKSRKAPGANNLGDFMLNAATLEEIDDWCVGHHLARPRSGVTRGRWAP